MIKVCLSKVDMINKRIFLTLPSKQQSAENHKDIHVV